MRGALAPGTALDEAGLARRFQVSRTPVREAIRLLAASGLVELRAHRGAVVARPSSERLNGMFETMAGLEALCAGLAAERMTADERRALEAAHADLQVLIQSGDAERYHAVNESFHTAIYSGAHNDYLAEITLSTRGRVQPFRRAQFRNLGRLAKSYAEHDRVVVAILQGDRAAAAEAMRSHIMTVWQEYAAYAEATAAINNYFAATFDCATKARQPPSAEMSRAPTVACASTRKPFTVRPSASTIVPIDSGGGTAATKRPNASTGIAQISSSIADPAPLATRSSPGFAGSRAGERQQAIVLGGRGRLEQACAGGEQFAVERHAGQMRADDGDRRLRARSRVTLQGASSGCGAPVAPSARPVSAWNTRPMDASKASAPAARQQRHPNGVPSGRIAAGSGEAAQFEQVDEVRVGAEPAVELDRIGEHLLDRIGGRHGRQHQRVDVAKDVVANAPQVFELVERREGVDGGRPRAVEDDLAGDRMHRFRRRRDQRAGDDVALGHPWPFVQQAGGLVERLDIDRDDRRRRASRTVRAPHRSSSADTASPKNSRWPGSGTPSLRSAGNGCSAPSGCGRE